MSEQPTMPALPKAAHLWRQDVPVRAGPLLSPLFTADQMHDYAGACVRDATTECSAHWEVKLRAAVADSVPKWISVTDGMPKPGQPVLACYTNSAGNVRRIRAHWIASKTEEASPEADFPEYDEATDTYWTPQGWYEQIDNWGDYSAVAVCEGEVTHWMPLPAPPAAAIRATPAPTDTPT